MDRMSIIQQAGSKILRETVLSERKAVYSPFPEVLLPEIAEYLRNEAGISGLYSHQAEMFQKATEGHNLVITTSTASGKTLSFLLPVLQEVLQNPLTRAVFLYPTKALAADQYRNMEPILRYFGKNRIQAGVYDGDTPVHERSRIRNSANLILTNPEMLNTAFLPHHNNFGFNFIFSNLKFMVIDELHAYRGAFGSHLANLFKRLGRICKYYNASPQMLCSSATIANPLELAETICGRSFTLVDNDGSPAPEKTYYIWQPPMAEGEFRTPPSAEAAELIPKLVWGNVSFIAFCKARKTVEVVLREARDRLKYDGVSGRDFSDLIAGYRGGYKPEERKEIERKMGSGKLRGLISTNALELGIDIGHVDVTVLAGFPGTRASFWQQSGRSGRKGSASTTFLLLDNLPFDQYIAIDPDWLFSQKSEHAVVDPQNLFIQLAHVRAAASEIPLSPDDISLFPDLGEIVPVLIKAGELRIENGRYVWCGKEFPSGDFNLRNMDKSRYKLKNLADDSIITEMDELQTFEELYNGAIYMHEGLSYQVERLDLIGRIAEARPIDVNYYTEPHDESVVERIAIQRQGPIGRTMRHYGDVRVTTTIFGYKRIQFHNHQNLGYEELQEHLKKSFETEGLWMDLPGNVVSLFRSLVPAKASNSDQHYWKVYLEGLSSAILNSAMRTTMTTYEDIGAAVLHDATGEEDVTAICIFDRYVGGLGFADKSYDFAVEIIENAIKMVSGCACKDGCPACVGDYKLDKALVLWGLRNLFEELPPLQSHKTPEYAPRMNVEKRFSLNDFPDRWAEFVGFARTTGEYMAGFLGSVESVHVKHQTLLLLVSNEFIKTWMLEEENHRKLKNFVEHYVKVPAGFKITAEFTHKSDTLLNPKVSKRLDDLLR